MVQKKQLKKCIVERIKIKKSDLKCFLQKRALSHCIYGKKKKSTDAFLQIQRSCVVFSQHKK